jgi:hypothetical protein
MVGNHDVQLLMEKNMEMLHLGIFTFSSGREAKGFKHKFEGGEGEDLLEIEKPGKFVSLRVYIIKQSTSYQDPNKPSGSGIQRLIAITIIVAISVVLVVFGKQIS